MSYLLAVAGVLFIGVAIQRGNTCTVGAIEDLVERRSTARAAAIASTWLWVAGGLALVVALGGPAPSFRAYAITGTTVVGGVLLGLGAVVNGACAVGTIARIGSGQWGYLATLAGFFGGSLAGRLGGEAAIRHEAITPILTTLDLPPLAVAAGLLVAGRSAVRLRRLLRTGRTARDFARQAWEPWIATALIGVVFVALVQAYGPWAYTDLLADVALGRSRDTLGRGGLLVALLAGALLAGAVLRERRWIRPTPGLVLRFLTGGALMGLGNELVPGAYDGLTLLGQPLLLPHAWVAMGICYLVIALATVAVQRGTTTRLQPLVG